MHLEKLLNEQLASSSPFFLFKHLIFLCHVTASSCAGVHSCNCSGLTWLPVEQTAVSMHRLPRRIHVWDVFVPKLINPAQSLQDGNVIIAKENGGKQQQQPFEGSCWWQLDDTAERGDDMGGAE